MTQQNVPADAAAPASRGALARPEPANLADVLERVLDKGIVIAGDIRVNLVEIELLTIKLRLLVASVDRAREMGIDWWEHDPMLSSRAREDGPPRLEKDARDSGDSGDSEDSEDSEESEDPRGAGDE